MASMDMSEEEGEADICLLELYQALSDKAKNKLKEMITPLSFFRCLRTVTDDICQ